MLSMMRFLLLLLMLLPIRSWSQDIINFLSPASKSTSIEVEGIYLPNKNVEDGRDETHVFERSGTIHQRLYRNEKNDFFVGARYRELDLSSSTPMLRDYYNHQLNLSYKRTMPGDLFWMTSISYGSASDRPFQDNRDNTLGVSYIQKFNPRWFGVLNYSNNRTFLNNIPLPGFFYVQEMSRDKALIFGFPFVYWLRPLGRKWSLRYFGLMPWSHKLRVFYKAGMLSPYIGFEQAPQSFFRHDREDEKDRVFWFERRIASGIEGTLGKYVRLDLSAGLAFDREFFEARNFSEEKENLNNLDKSLFAALNLRLSF